MRRLADVLSDPASRDKLIEELRSLSEQNEQKRAARRQ